MNRKVQLLFNKIPALGIQSGMVEADLSQEIHIITKTQGNFVIVRPDYKLPKISGNLSLFMKLIVVVYINIGTHLHQCVVVHYTKGHVKISKIFLCQIIGSLVRRVDDERSCLF